MLGAPGEISQVVVRKTGIEPLHVILRLFDEVVANTVPDAARSAVQHDPHLVGFIQAELDEVIPGTECTEMVHAVGSSQGTMFIHQSLVAFSKVTRKSALNPIWDALPSTAIAPSAALIASMWNCTLDIAPDTLLSGRSSAVGWSARPSSHSRYRRQLRLE